MQNPAELAEKFLGVPYETLDERAKNVARLVAERRHVARDAAKELDASMTRGQRAADAVAAFGGSWIFITCFIVIMIVWVGLNSVILAKYSETFDPYPYILLNLFLSMLAAIQAPIILMAQNRQSYKDRMSAEHDYEINLKAELEIMLLHEKVDILRDKQWTELLNIQKEQMEALKNLLVSSRTSSDKVSGSPAA
ncbi:MULTISPECIES: DUF1003 domain-containing protein [Burkholderia]|uniref:Cyclic nucleotide-binding protein n=1 Tax=Burkholderia ubonensis subsp. mesacidophila TaxID=265293 RepID=A0A2A4FC55_9BURK|nr:MULTISPECIES: DUF1003 domain-containing protein [Burkholderia]PCE30240.1 cyclic nucleotide-binding protein [Burkholderia ubonensis subsp. mesacidophila]